MSRQEAFRLAMLDAADESLEDLEAASPWVEDLFLTASNRVANEGGPQALLGWLAGSETE